MQNTGRMMDDVHRQARPHLNFCFRQLQNALTHTNQSLLVVNQRGSGKNIQYYYYVTPEPTIRWEIQEARNSVFDIFCFIPPLVFPIAKHHRDLHSYQS